jgi:phenylacetic acid degradation operon negative regulatory protein
VIVSRQTTSRDDEAGPYGPAAAYDLAGLAAAYSAFVERYSPLLESVRGGEIGAAEALVLRTSLMDSWRIFADTDPDLPEHMSPVPWPRRAAREVFLEIHSALGPPAEARLVEVARPHWPQAASWITRPGRGAVLQMAPQGRPDRRRDLRRHELRPV